MPRRAEACVACARTFEVGETFRAYLYEAESGYARRDYCLGCTPPSEPVPLGSWKTRRPQPIEGKALRFDAEAIYTFFERLEDATEPRQVQFRFVLALLLWRKKVLVLEHTHESDGAEYWEFHAPKLNVTHRVERPTLDEQQLEDLSNQLEQLLAGRSAEPCESTETPAAE